MNDDNLKEQQTDDVSIEVDSELENPKDTIKALREKIKILTKEKQEYLDGWQRLKADTVNARKRDEEMMKERLQYAVEPLIEDLIPVLESFGMARANKEAWEKVDKNWRMGVEYIERGIIGTLKQHGLVSQDPQGETFDPTKHEAISYEPVTDEGLGNKILKTIQPGYTLHNKVIRFPKVVVGEYKKD